MRQAHGGGSGPAGRLPTSANTELFRAYHQVARADLAVLAGRHETALRLIAQAQPAILAADAPPLEFEEARVRARALRGLGRDAVASRQARAALALANERRWSWTGGCWEWCTWTAGSPRASSPTVTSTS